MPNPFEIRSAELMRPEHVGREFVKDHTEHSKLASHSHTVVWGSRGSGKSMHFKFLEPLAQACQPDAQYAGDVRKFLQDPNAFLGIYINCRDGILHREELGRVCLLPNADAPFLDMLLSRYFACVIVKALVNTLTKQLSWICSVPVQATSLPAWARRVVRTEDKTLGEVLARLLQANDSWLLALNDLVDLHLLNPMTPPDRDSFPRDSPRLTTDVLDLMDFLRGSADLAVPFFLLFDEANELCEVHQRCVNSMMAQRSQRTLCIKVASQKRGFVPGPRLRGDVQVDETHDYTTLDLDGLYTNNRQAYYRRIELIANDRLRAVGMEVDINSYLPVGERQSQLLEEARHSAEERYLAIPEEKRPRDKANFIKKYAPAIVFQELIPAKAADIYAGFDNVVHLSSGIVRSFIDCCFRMYEKFVEKNPGLEPTEVPIQIQSDVIKQYSNEFIQAQLVDRISAPSTQPAQRELYRNVHSLLKGLGALFRARLLDKSSREPRIISISLKDEAGDELQKVLDVAEREAFLHAKWYGSKRGDRNLRCYVLNRRLCPHFNLDLMGFQGRIEVTAEQLGISLTDPDGFARTVLRDAPEEAQGDPRQLTFFEW